MAVLDLHGLTWAEAREELVEAYNAAVRRQDALPFEVIHGYGASGKGGTLRSAVRTFLAANGIAFHAGEAYDRNPGHTLIVPGKPLPTVTDRLHLDILAYCENPRTKSEITGRFRRQGEPEVMAALATLKRLKMLQEVTDKGRKKFARV